MNAPRFSQPSLTDQLLLGVRKALPIGQRSDADVYFVAFTLCGAVFLVPIALALSSFGFEASATSAWLALGGVAASIALWRWSKRLLPAMLLFESTLLATLLYNVSLTGGLASPVLVWLGVVPLMMLFVVSKFWCNVFLLLCLGCVLALFAMASGQALTTSGGLVPSELKFAALMHCAFNVTQMILVSTIESVNLRQLRRIVRDNARLNQLARALKQANEHKDKFLSSVSHEMRTPLNGVHGYLALLHKRGDLPEEANEQISNAYASAGHLLTIINDLLDYSQIRQGQFTLNLQPVQLAPLLLQVHKTLRAQAQEKGLAYTINGLDGLPAWCRVDPQRLTQILLNLLGNAIKFTDKGSVSLDALYEAGAQGAGTLWLTVRDTGCGMAPDQRERIFEPFVQLPNHTGTQGVALRGNGLGLSITAALLRAWKGRIEVQSTPGQGSSFRVGLPVALAQARSQAPADEKPLSSDLQAHQRILIVDDHTMNRLVAKATILREAPNCVIDEAQNGQEALSKMGSTLYDLVLLDILMPDISGIEVLRQVRTQMPAPYCHVPVLAFTANLAADLVAQCEAVGFSGLIPKPFNIDALMQSIRTQTHSH